jgi:FkbM family methyltransferase
MTLIQLVITKLWWGPLRLPFEALMRRTVGKYSMIAVGPMKGREFSGGLSQQLGIYELHVQYAILNNLNEGNTFYDIGANTGYFSLLGSHRVGSEGCVYAFEPYPRNIDMLQKTIKDNCLTNIRLERYALSDSCSGVRLFLSTGQDHATASLIPEAGQESLTVETRTLDEFLTSHEWPHLIKLDVEGAEHLVLQGASRILTDDRPITWLIEVHSLDNDEKVQQILRAHRFRIESLKSYKGRQAAYPRHILARRP